MRPFGPEVPTVLQNRPAVIGFLCSVAHSDFPGNPDMCGSDGGVVAKLPGTFHRLVLPSPL